MWSAIADPRYRLIAKFCLERFILSPLLAKKPNFCRFWTSAFSVVANWQQSDKVEQECTTTNLPLSNGIKIVSVLQRLHGEIGQTTSDVQTRDEQTNRQTDRQKTQPFWPPRRRMKSEPHQTWHGDRGLRARSCTSKTFGGLTHSFATMGSWKFGDNQTPSTSNPHNSINPWATPTKF